MSTPMGFRYLYNAGYIDREMDMWFHVRTGTSSELQLTTSVYKGTEHLLRSPSRDLLSQGIQFRSCRG